MAKKSKAESLNVEDLGDLSQYVGDELVQLREKLIADVERIHQESAHHAKHIKEHNQARHELQQQLAERARSLRAVKHVLTQQAREPQATSWRPAAAQKVRSRQGAGARRAGQ